MALTRLHPKPPRSKMSEEEQARARREAVRRWRARHPEKARAALYDWRQRNREKLRAIDKRSRDKHSASRLVTIKAWNKKHPERLVQYARRHQFAKTGILADLTIDEWLEILRLAEGRCFYCHETRKLEQDHVVPVSRGGAHTKSNIVAACRFCNASKHAKTPAEWKRVASEGTR
jgi:5-methylcytosine-specific restriction endonuclease McrA